jgi:hypothetical protein
MVRNGAVCLLQCTDLQHFLRTGMVLAFLL